MSKTEIQLPGELSVWKAAERGKGSRFWECALNSQRNNSSFLGVSDYQRVLNVLYVSAFVLRNPGEVPFGFRCQEFTVSDNSKWGAKFGVGAVSACRLVVGS